MKLSRNSLDYFGAYGWSLVTSTLSFPLKTISHSCYDSHRYSPCTQKNTRQYSKINHVASSTITPSKNATGDKNKPRRWCVKFAMRTQIPFEWLISQARKILVAANESERKSKNIIKLSSGKRAMWAQVRFLQSAGRWKGNQGWVSSR